MITLPYAYGQPPIQGQLRVTPEDFQVREEMSFALDGAGEHVWLWVRKRNANTEWVAKRLAEQAGVLSGAVEHSHFVFKVHDYGETILLDPWILFWQMYRDQQASATSRPSARDKR